MHWKIALCSLSIGISTAPLRRAASTSNAPAMTSDSLFATRTCLPARAAASVDGSPAAPTMAAITTSTSGLAATALSASTPQATAVGHSAARRSSASNRAAAGILQDRDRRPESQALVEQRRPVRAGGQRRDHVAIGMTREHVERADTDAAGAAEDRDPLHVDQAQRQQPEQERRRRRGQAVDAVEDAAVTGQQLAAVLQADVTLEHAFGQVADDRHQRDEFTEQQPRPERHVEHERAGNGDQRLRPACRPRILPRSCPGSRAARACGARTCGRRSTRRRRPRRSARAGKAAATGRAAAA